VAAGVEHHSRFRSHPLRRAWVTADAALRLTFGDDEVARGAVRQIYRVHDRINGPVDAAGPATDEACPTGSYTAHDASLLLWVWATLVDTAETAYTRWVRPFEVHEGAAFYTEMRSMGSFLGIPDDMLPPDRVTFARYVDDVLDDERLGSSDTSRRMARQVLWFSHWSVPPAAVWLQRVLALATLDPRVVHRLDLQPCRADVEAGRRVDGLLSSYYRRLPRLPARLPARLPSLYVLFRRPSIGLADHLRRLPALLR
jgi:uncharacterized protein (DUF2236 family)